jgi:hypothetical protein
MDQLSEFDNNFLVSPLAQSHLKETAKWAKFLAIVGFVFTGFIALFAIFAGTIMSSFSTISPELSMFPAAGLSFAYLFFAAIYFIPCLFLFQFAQKVNLALKQSDSEVLAYSLGRLKSFFLFVGILTLLIVALYALALIFIILGTSLALL